MIASAVSRQKEFAAMQSIFGIAPMVSNDAGGAITVPYFAGAVLISVFVHKIWNQDSVVEKLRKAV